MNGVLATIRESLSTVGIINVHNLDLIARKDTK